MNEPRLDVRQSSGTEAPPPVGGHPEPSQGRSPTGGDSHRAAMAGAALVLLGALATACFEPPNSPPQPAYLNEKIYVCGWDPASRTGLESAVRMGLVAVHYADGELRVLSQCQVAGQYKYVATEPNTSKVTIKNQGDLHASLPLAAAKLEARLEAGASFDLALSLIGRYENRELRPAPELFQGDCADVTHVIIGVSIGAFELTTRATFGAGAGAQVSVANAGIDVGTSKDTLDQSGTRERCAVAGPHDADPPAGCSAVVQVDLYPVRPPRPAEPPESPEWKTASDRAATLPFSIPPIEVMPPGETWQGVYSLPAGPFHLLVTDGDKVSGVWSSGGGSTWGEVEGIVNGDLFLFSWEEHVKCGTAPGAVVFGGGYFKYASNGHGGPARLIGEIAPGSDGVSATVEAPKQRNLTPQPAPLRQAELARCAGEKD